MLVPIVENQVIWLKSAQVTPKIKPTKEWWTIQGMNGWYQIG